MKQHKWLVALLATFIGVLFFSFNGNTTVKADYGDWYDGVPEFLSDYTFTDSYGAQINYDSDDNLLQINGGQNNVTGDDLSYERLSKHVYYIEADDDLGIVDEENFETAFKIKIISGDRIKVYYSQNDDGSGMQYWDTYTAE